MAFVLTIVQIEEALKLPGCAVCRLREKAIHKSAEGFLYENTLNAAAREPVLKARGFCPEHTRLVAAIELSKDGSTLGINNIYEELARSVARELSGAAKPRGKATLSSRLKTAVKQPSLPRCPLCKLGEESAENYLSALFEELEAEESATRAIYEESSGLCYPHLHSGLENMADKHPHTASYLAEHARRQLVENADLMHEYIRKHDWHYRDEKLTQEELNAWRSTLSFFTGLPTGKFSHKVEE
jgi:hypothetical protein